MKKIILVLATVLICDSYSSNAQVYIKIRPERPHYERVVAPSPRHVWIEDDWEPRNGAYVFIGGRWVEPPQPGWVWIPGHWKETPRGWMWRAGHWRRR